MILEGPTYLRLSFSLFLNNITPLSGASFKNTTSSIEVRGLFFTYRLGSLLILWCLRLLSDLLCGFNCLARQVYLFETRFPIFISMYREIVTFLCIMFCTRPCLRKFDRCCWSWTILVVASYMMFHQNPSRKLITYLLMSAYSS